MSEMQKKLGVNIFVSEIERVGNYPDFEKNGARNSARLELKISKVSQRRKTILVLYCRSGPAA